MTSDDHRAECIEAMARAAHAKDVSSEIEPRAWEEEIEEVREFWINVEAAAFDALDGIVFVDSIEATGEMIEAYRSTPHNSSPAARFKAMAAVGNLTKPPEEKP